MTDAKNRSASSSFGVTPSSARATIALRSAGVAVFGTARPVAIARKFASCFAPPSEPMDSGWYWSDSIGSVLCRSPMISPSSASAVISKQSGSVARSTASEW